MRKKIHINAEIKCIKKSKKKKQHIFLKLYKQYIHIWIQST
jgi:hypothetical protein